MQPSSQQQQHPCACTCAQAGPPGSPPVFNWEAMAAAAAARGQGVQQEGWVRHAFAQADAMSVLTAIPILSQESIPQLAQLRSQLQATLERRMSPALMQWADVGASLTRSVEESAAGLSEPARSWQVVAHCMNTLAGLSTGAAAPGPSNSGKARGGGGGAGAAGRGSKGKKGRAQQAVRSAAAAGAGTGAVPGGGAGPSQQQATPTSVQDDPTALLHRHRVLCASVSAMRPHTLLMAALSNPPAHPVYPAGSPLPPALLASAFGLVHAQRGLEAVQQAADAVAQALGVLGQLRDPRASAEWGARLRGEVALLSLAGRPSDSCLVQAAALLGATKDSALQGVERASGTQASRVLVDGWVAAMQQYARTAWAIHHCAGVVAATAGGGQEGMPPDFKHLPSVLARLRLELLRAEEHSTLHIYTAALTSAMPTGGLAPEGGRGFLLRSLGQTWKSTQASGALSVEWGCSCWSLGN